MKNPLLRCLLLCAGLLSSFLAAQIPPQYDGELITEAEARDFMQQVLWLCNYGRRMQDQPNEQFVRFLGDSLQQILQTQDGITYQYNLHSALIHKVNLPWIEVLTTNGVDSHNWRMIKRFQVKKEQGKLFLLPHYEKRWSTTIVRAWQEEYEIPFRPFTKVEQSTIRADVIAYLDDQFPPTKEVNWTREQLLGHWRIDSTYSFQNGRKIASFSLAEYLFLYDGKFYNVNESYMIYGGEFLNHPGSWGLSNHHLFTISGIQVDLYTVEEVVPHRLLLKRQNAYWSDFLLLSNLPKAVETSETSHLIEHPDVEVILQPIHDFIGRFNDTLAEVRSGAYMGLIDYAGKAWLPLEYDQLWPFYGRSFTFGQREGKWYKINTQGEEFETLPYDDFIDMMGALLVVKDKKGKVGAMDQEGKLILPFDYDMVLLQGDKLFKVMKDRKTGLVREHGEVIIPLIYEDLMPMENGLYRVEVSGKQGVIDPSTGKLLLEPVFDYLFKDDQVYQAKQNGQLSLFDLDFQAIELPDYELMIYQRDGYLGVEKNGKRGIVNIQGEILTPIVYDDVWLTSAGIQINQAGKWGMLDYKGKPIVPTLYDELDAHENLICTKKGNYWGLLDQNGNEVLPAIYDELMVDHRNSPIKHCKIRKDGKVSIINLEGENLLGTAHEEVYFPRPLFPGSEEIWYAFEDNNKHGYLNSEGEVAIPALYDYAFFFESSGFAKVEWNGKSGLIDQKNEVIVPFIFEYLDFQIDRPVIVVRYEGLYGLIANPIYKKQ